MKADMKEALYTQDDEIDLYELLAVMKKRYRLILGILLIAIVVTGIVSFVLPPIYKISASIAPGWLELKDDGKIIPLDSAKNIESSIKKGSHTDKIIETLKLPPEEYSEIAFNTTLEKGSDVIHVYYETKNPEEGIGIVNELLNNIQDYYRMRIETREKKIDKSIQLLQNDILMKENQKARIINRKKTILSNMQLNKDKMRLLNNTEESLRKQISEVDANTKEIMQQRTDLLKQGKDVKDTVSLLLYSNTIQQNISYIDRLNSQLDENQLEQESVKNHINNMAIGLKNEDIELNDMDTKISNVTQKIATLNIRKSEIEGVRIVQQPLSSFRPVKPKKTLNMAIAGIASLFFSVFLAFFLEWIEKGKAREQEKA
jgi:capsular polysaccharide biosynthesis protein